MVYFLIFVWNKRKCPKKRLGFEIVSCQREKIERIIVMTSHVHTRYSADEMQLRFAYYCINIRKDSSICELGRFVAAIEIFRT